MNTSLKEVVLSSALGDGSPMPWVDRDEARWDNTNPRERSSLRRIAGYITEVKPPAYPLPVDAPLAEDGQAVYETTCVGCHAPGSARVGAIVPLDEIGTDRHRRDMWAPDAAAAYNDYGEGRRGKCSGFCSTAGYMAVPHEGLWLRGPYLHKGSVPTLMALLDPVANRPTRSWRGYDLFDPVKVEFAWLGAEAERVSTSYDTSQPGNSNVGHEFGTTLPETSKRALPEYLKTL